MSKVMEPTSLSALFSRIAGEYRAKSSIFDIPEAAFREAFELEAESRVLDLPGGRVRLPVGPAAGPHSQMAPNLIAAYLSGARVFELKTVQENDSLDIDKPCIDALDEGHNTEWSTELSLGDARDEYLRGWIAVRLLAALFSPAPEDFVFNASVGYTLDGIKSAKVDGFLEALREPSSAPNSDFWEGAARELEAFAKSQDLKAAFGNEAPSRALALASSLPTTLVSSVTISTMHGCPPDEIERIASYLIEEKGFNVYVKLNPTLLGYDRVRSILDKTGWGAIRIDKGLFERDLKMPEAIRLARSLSSKAESRGLVFGLKLSNTLANANDGSFLPGAERYMSGRPLFPITVSLAADLAAALPDWKGRFSYCGGASAINAGRLIEAGLRPVTIATDMLKPGGYLRLTGAARAAARAMTGSKNSPDADALRELAEEALVAAEYRSDYKTGTASIRRRLPLFDCFSAPCVEACPVGQNAPGYIRLGAEMMFADAFETIVAENPLPHITGTLCDHICQAACSRNDYEGPVLIRAAKLACARAGSGLSRPLAPRAPELAAGKVAVVGAGPAGLACAYYLALRGVRVTVFDQAREIGGVPTNVIPPFRIERRFIAADIDRIRSLGVEFSLGVRVDSLEQLKSEGHSSVFIGSGAPAAKKLSVEGDGVPVVDALDFLKSGGIGRAGVAHIVVAGGGNTAMDASRLALRLPGVERVTVSYRRTRAEMPADREELDNAIAEGAVLRELSLPERAIPSTDGGHPRIRLRAMALGEKDASGRRAPSPTDKYEDIDCDLLVAAIGESPDRALFDRLGVATDPDGKPLFDPHTMMTNLNDVYVGGDAARGPSSIISAAADGRRAALAILERSGVKRRSAPVPPPAPDPKSLAARGKLLTSLDPSDPDFLKRESERCLRCDSSCLRCVEVCPNRANTAIGVERGVFAQGLQILHIDSLCNECGNCSRFCPYQGDPCKDKPTLFPHIEALSRSHNVGFAFDFPSPPYGARPRVALRERAGGPVVEAVIEAPEGQAPAWGISALLELARGVLEKHPYLLGGPR